MAELKRKPNQNWTFSEGCGCQVTFFAESNYHTSRMLPGKDCPIHAEKNRGYARDTFVARAKVHLQEYLSLPMEETMSEQAKCQLCGEPMPPGEEMFNYHGYSGPCPKPTLPKIGPSTVSREIAARVWQDQEMRLVVMDVEAAEEIAKIIDKVRQKAGH